MANRVDHAAEPALRLRPRDPHDRHAYRRDRHDRGPRRGAGEPVRDVIAVLGTNEHAIPTVRLEDIVAPAKPRGIPDRWSMRPRSIIERPSPWLVRGADLVIYSGGKFLRGPQTSGLLLGRKDLVQAAWRNASPHQALGRPMKVSKEDIIGVLAAVEYWLQDRDVAAEERRWNDRLQRDRGEGRRRSGVTSEKFCRPRTSCACRACASLADREASTSTGHAAAEAAQRLAADHGDDTSLTADSITARSVRPAAGRSRRSRRRRRASFLQRRSASPPLRSGSRRYGQRRRGRLEIRVEFLHGERHAADPHRTGRRQAHSCKATPARSRRR